VLVEINSEFYRPAEVELLLGDPSKAEQELDWVRKTDFNGLIKKMVDNDINS
jgi:GDPmannose 4,6-dehydratase